MLPRVLFVDHVDRILGGAEINLIELLATQGVRKQWEVGCACSPGSPLSKAFESMDVRQFAYGLPREANELRVVGKRFSASRSWKGWRALAAAKTRLGEVVKEYQPNILISCTNKDHFCAGAVGRVTGVPSVWWVNDILSGDFFSWPARKMFHWQANRLAQTLVVVSKYAKEALVREGMKEHKIQVIHNGIPSERYGAGVRGRWREANGLSAQEIVVGMVGRFTPWKGQDLFVRLARDWIRAGREGTFVLVGKAFNEEKEFEEGLRRWVRENGLEERIRFIPFQSDVSGVLVDLDVFVHASLRPEPFGRVIIEAMAAGVPVLGAEDGGVREIIQSGVNGWLARPNDPVSYMEGLESILKDRSRSRQIAANAMDRVQNYFHVDRVAADFLKLVEEAISKKGFAS